MGEGEFYERMLSEMSHFNLKKVIADIKNEFPDINSEKYAHFDGANDLDIKDIHDVYIADVVKFRRKWFGE